VTTFRAQRLLLPIILSGTFVQLFSVTVMQVGVVDVRRDLVDMNDRPSRIGVPQPGVVFDRVVADGHQHVGVTDQDVTGLVAEKPDSAHEVILEFARYHAGGLEGLHHRQVRDGEQFAQRRTRCRVAGPHAHEQYRVLCRTNHLGI